MRKPKFRITPTPCKHAPPHDLTWAYVEPPPTPMPTADQVAALEVAERVRTPRKPHRPRPPQHCTVGYGYYATSAQRVPTLRLRGYWLERLGFAIGSKLRLVVREGELVVTVDPSAPGYAAGSRPS